MDKTIFSQIPCDDKYGLGYKASHFEKGSSSMTAGKEAEQKSYVDVIKDSINKEECMPWKKNKRRWNKQPIVESTREEAYKKSYTTDKISYI